jgi:hypothetical protein
MTETIKLIDPEELARQLVPSAGATAYPPLPIDPFDGRATAVASGDPPSPAPRPQPKPAPGGPAYPSMPLDPDTKGDDKPGERR